MLVSARLLQIPPSSALAVFSSETRTLMSNRIRSGLGFMVLTCGDNQNPEPYTWCLGYTGAWKDTWHFELKTSGTATPVMGSCRTLFGCSFELVGWMEEVWHHSGPPFG